MRSKWWAWLAIGMVVGVAAGVFVPGLAWKFETTAFPGHGYLLTKRNRLTGETWTSYGGISWMKVENPANK